MTIALRSPISAIRLAAAALLFGAAAAGAAQEALSPLPPPVTRSQYRSQWFEFLSAFSENDAAGANRALEAMLRAGRKVGVSHLSDFSRTAVFLGRRAEKLGQPDRAVRAYDAALKLDESNPDAIVARLSFLARHGRTGEALKAAPDAAVALLSTHEARVAIASSFGLWLSIAIAGMLLVVILALGVRHVSRIAHDIAEAARRTFGRSGAVPLGFVILGLPLFVGLGPGWLVLYWGALLYAYGRPRERAVLAAGFVAMALVPGLLAWITAANVEQRSPLFVAATDLAERRDDASAEDGLRQAAAVFPEDSEVWYLLGIYAERSGDLERAQSDYSRAMQADSADYRPILNRGNVRFTEGDYGEAIRDYIEAARREPKAAETFYNLSLARGEAYDFDGQAAAMRQAREVSASQVNFWTGNPTLSRVVPAGYTVERARARMALWDAQPKSRRLPGHGSSRGWKQFLSWWSLAPLGALLLGIYFAGTWRLRGVAEECDRCGRPFCARCKHWGETSPYCAECSRLSRKEEVDIEEQVAQTRSMQGRAVRRHRIRRLASLLLPGSHAIDSGRPVRGAAIALVFFFGLGAAILDDRVFDPFALPPEGPLRLTVVAGAALALVVWLRAQWGARSVSDGS